MSIIKTKKGPNPFAQIDRTVLEDDRLSWRAKGVLCYLLSKPNDWEVRSDDLISRGTEGREALRSAMLELKEHGYAILISHQDSYGRMTGRSWEIFERPQTVEGNNRKTEKPSHGETPPSNKEEESNKDKKKEERSLTLPYSSDEFKEAWKNWEEYRKEKKAKLTRKTIEGQFNLLKDWGEPKAIEAIKTAINMGWRGIFEPKASLVGKPYTPTIQHSKASQKPNKEQWQAILDQYHMELNQSKAEEKMRDAEMCCPYGPMKIKEYLDKIGMSPVVHSLIYGGLL